MQRRALPHERTSPTLARQGASHGMQGVETVHRTGRGRGKFLGAVLFLAVFGVDEERAGDDGMAVVNSKWAQMAR
jgi:hypothetical protein